MDGEVGVKRGKQRDQGKGGKYVKEVGRAERGQARQNGHNIEGHV